MGFIFEMLPPQWGSKKPEEKETKFKRPEQMEDTISKTF